MFTLFVHLFPINYVILTLRNVLNNLTHIQVENIQVT